MPQQCGTLPKQNCHLIRLSDASLSIVFSFLDKRQSAHVAACCKLLCDVLQQPLTRRLHKGPIVGHVLCMTSLIASAHAFHHGNSNNKQTIKQSNKVRVPFFFFLNARNLVFVVLLAKPHLVIVSDANYVVAVFEIDASRSSMRRICLLSSANAEALVDFRPMALAASESRNECYICSGLSDGRCDQIYVFDMSSWKLLRRWSIPHDTNKCRCGGGHRYSTIAFNEANGLLYIPNLPLCGLCVMNPATGTCTPDLACFQDIPNLQHITRASTWTGDIGHFGTSCFVISFASTVRIYSCDTMKPVLSFYLRFPSLVYSIQFYNGEFYVGEFIGPCVAVYSSSGVYKRIVPLSRIGGMHCVSICASSQTMSLLNCGTGQLFIVE